MSKSISHPSLPSSPSLSYVRVEDRTKDIRVKKGPTKSPLIFVDRYVPVHYPRTVTGVTGPCHDSASPCCGACMA